MIDNVKKIVLSFCAGLGIGVVSGKIYYEKKYKMKLKGATFNSDKEQPKEEPKEEPKEASKEEPVEEKDQKESSEINKNKNDLSEMAKKVKDENPRVDYSTPVPGEKEKVKEEKPEKDHYIDEDYEVEPEDFGELADENYDVVNVLYLADGNLVYENGETFMLMEEPMQKIGNKALSILRNNPSDDVLYVRNKRTKIDYEIVLDDRTLNEGMSEEDEEDDEE